MPERGHSEGVSGLPVKFTAMRDKAIKACQGPVSGSELLMA